MKTDELSNSGDSDIFDVALLLGYRYGVFGRAILVSVVGAES